MTGIRNQFIRSSKQAPALVPALFFAISLLSCKPRVENYTHDGRYALLQSQRWHYFDSVIMPAALKKIKSGDIIFRLGTDITSELFRMMNEDDKRYSHCGIASIENDTVFIYHALGGELTPDQPVQRHTLYQFAHPVGNKALGIAQVKLDSSQKAKIIEWATLQYRQQIPFDMKFDYTSDSKLYCTEFVAKSLNAGMRGRKWLQLRHRGNKSYVTPDQLYNNIMTDTLIRFKY